MELKEKLAKLKELDLLKELGEEKLTELARLLDPVAFPKGQVVMEEGSVGDSLFFIIEGKVRIEKELSGEGAAKELATLSPGDFFGEMAIVEDTVRSARAVAAADALLFQLQRDDLFGWLKASPELTLAFFLALLATLSHRLRVTTREQALLYDISTVFLEAHPDGRRLVAKVVQKMVHYLEGNWTVAGFLYNEFNEEYELAAAEGAGAAEVQGKMPPVEGAGWADGKTLWAALPGRVPPDGFLFVSTPDTVGPRVHEEIGRVAATVAKLLVSALKNIRHAQEEQLRARLKSQSI